MRDMIQDPMFVYAVALVIFLVLAVVFGRKPALGWIDGEIDKIRAELDQARQLRLEAEAALKDCQQRQAAAEAEAKQIISGAQKQVEAMRKKAEQDLTASLARYEQTAAERIRRAEADAIAEVRAAAVDLAMGIARKNLTENLSSADAAKLVDQAIADLPALGDKKAKAA